MTEAMYRFTLERIAGKRTLAPNTPEAIHASLSRAHPRLVEAMQGVYPDIESVYGSVQQPAEVFRGSRCMTCGRTLSDPESLALGIGPECRHKGVKG